MRILAFIPFRTSLPTATARVVPLVYGLSKRGHRVTILSPYCENIAPKENFVCMGPTRACNTLLSRFRSSFQTFLLLARECQNNDAIFASKHLPRTLLPLYIIDRFRGLPPVVLDIDDYELGFVMKRWGDSPFSLGFAFLQSVLLNFVSAITVASKELVRRYRNTSVKNITYVPNAADLDRFKLPREILAPVQPTTFVWLGNIDTEHIRGLRLLLDACSLVKVDLEIHVVGDGSSLTELRDTVVARHLEGKVRIRGRIDPIAIPAYLSQADASLLPLVESNVDRAKAPIKLFEYMAAGIPIVTTDVGEGSNLVREIGNGLVVEPTAESFAQAMEQIVQRREYWRQKGLLGRDYLREHQNYETLTNDLERTLQMAISQRIGKSRHS